MIKQLLVHRQGLVQILLRTGRSSSGKRHLLLELLHPRVPSVAVLDHAEGFCVLASLVCRRFGHRLGGLASLLSTVDAVAALVEELVLRHNSVKLHHLCVV